MDKKGFINIALAVLAILVLGGAGVYYYLETHRNYGPAGTFVNLPPPSPTPTADVTAGWKTYTNTKYGFEFKYPSGLVVNAVNEDQNQGTILGLSKNINNINGDRIMIMILLHGAIKDYKTYANQIEQNGARQLCPKNPQDCLKDSSFKFGTVDGVPSLYTDDSVDFSKESLRFSIQFDEGRENKFLDKFGQSAFLSTFKFIQ